MFNFLKKLKKEKKEENRTEEKSIAAKQDLSNGIARGMYCELCGYMEVNEDSNELPMEGYAICPNCGGTLKIGWFMKTEDGYHLAENAAPVALEKKKASGGHYRVRKPGPNRSRRKENRNH